MEYVGKPGSSYWSQPEYAQHFEMKRMQLQANNSVHGITPKWTEIHEQQLVDKLHMGWFDEPYGGFPWTYPDLNLDSLVAVPLRKRVLAPFKINYETFQEIKLRLMNTVISIKGHAFLVVKIKQHGSKFLLGLQGADEKVYSVKYDDLYDLRTIPPMYVTTNRTGWLCRIPGRVYQQGINRQNTHIKMLTGDTANLDVLSLVKNIGNRKDRRFDETVGSLLKSGELANVRLSDEVAVGRREDKIMACFRGRALGEVKDNDIVVMDEDDLLQSWIDTAVKAVNMELRA